MNLILSPSQVVMDQNEFCEEKKEKRKKIKYQVFKLSLLGMLINVSSYSVEVNEIRLRF